MERVSEVKQNLHSRHTTGKCRQLFFGSAKAVSAALAILALTACSRESEPTATPANIEELKSAVAAILKEHSVPGIGIALVTKDKVVWTGGVGKADIAANRDVSADTMFRVGSITKGFVALTALQLVEQRKLDLDEKVADAAPEIPVVNPWQASSPVTLAELLEHTAGFDDFSLAEFYDFDAPPEKPLTWTLNHFRGPEVVRWKPGSRMSYSNPGYGLAGYLLEKVGGAPLENQIAANILRPLGMTHSDLRLTPEVKEQLAQGYEDGSPVPYYPIYLRPAGELKSSPNEMARFIRMMLNRGKLDGVRIVSPESITRMETPETSLAARAGLKNGYGLGNYADLEFPILQRGHDGGIDGFLSRYIYIPEAGAGYFYSINASGRAGFAMRKLDALLYNFMTRGVKAHQEPAVKMGKGSSEWAGYYEPRSPRQAMLRYAEILTGGQFVNVDALGVHVRPLFGTPRTLIPVGTNLFRTEKGAAAETIFTTDGKDNVVMISAVPPGIPVPVYFLKTSSIWPMTRLVLVLGALFVMLTSVVFAIIWIPRKLFGRMKGAPHLAVRILPLLATISLLAAFATVLTSAPVYLARPGFASITYFLGTIAFAILSIASLALALTSMRWPMSRGVQIHSLLVATACVGLTSYLAYWHQLGIRLWQPW
jgi:CubicO group peptidase (beta-lactamase class C family)